MVGRYGLGADHGFIATVTPSVAPCAPIVAPATRKRYASPTQESVPAHDAARTGRRGSGRRCCAAGPKRTARCAWSADGLGLERLCAADVSMFLARECPKRSVSGARDLVCALRSLLRFLHLAGLIDAPLVWAVPSVADLRDRTLPRGLEPAAVKKLLASCDRRKLVGRRDYAILLLLLAAWAARRRGRRDRAGRPRLARRTAARRGQGRPSGRVAVAGRCRRGAGVLSSSPSAVREPGAVLAGDRAAHWVEPQHDRVGCARGVRPGGAAAGRGAPAAAYRRDRDAPAGRIACGDRPGAAPPRAENNRDIRVRCSCT